MAGPGKAATTHEDNHPRPAVTVDVVVFSLQEEDLKVLLVQRKHPPFQGCWAIPGGFVDIDESLEDAARRELQEETGVTGPYLEQLYTFGEPDRDPRGRTISVAYFALLPPGEPGQVRAGDDAEEARWFSVYHLPELAFDHSEIMRYALTRLRYKIEYTAVAFRLLPEAFTLTELQRVYQIILGEKLDPANFRRKILSTGVIEATGSIRRGEGRPARLYRFRDTAPAESKARRLFP